MSFKDLESLLGEVAPLSSRRGPTSADAPLSSRTAPLVLVVDDDESVRSALNFLLSSTYRVVTCATAIEALDSFTDDVCVIILDVKMKGHDGFWACDQLRKRQPDIPIIFYSAYQDAKDPFDIINAHRPFGYVTKDGSTDKLLRTVDLAAQLYQSTLRSRRIIERIKNRRGSRPP